MRETPAPMKNTILRFSKACSSSSLNEYPFSKISFNVSVLQNEMYHLR